MAKLTPMMRQYIEIKEKHKDCLLLYRLGDFYELFFEDAATASKELGLTLTKRHDYPMAGVPYHAVQSYIDTLIKKGYKVAICEQTSDPKAAKGIVDRDVVRIITPGTVIENAMLSETENNYIVSVFTEENKVGIAYADVSTGDFYIGDTTADGDYSQVISEISRILPSEIIYAQSDKALMDILAPMIAEQSIYISEYPAFTYEKDTAADSLMSHFNVLNLAGFGLAENSIGICAGGALIDYLRETQKNALAHINTIKVNNKQEFMALDVFTRANLELTKTLREGKVRGSLFGVVDKTRTAMGARLLKRYINEPLQNRSQIELRLNAVQELKKDLRLMDDIENAIDGVFDLERLISRISYASLDARNCLALKASLIRLPALKSVLSDCQSALLQRLHGELDVMEDIHALLEVSIEENPPIGITNGGIIKQGYNAQIDELKVASRNGKEWIASLQASEQQATGIKKLKIGYNKVFGYYIEVTKSYLELVPYRYIRKQTLANCERFVTPELKEMEEKILGAQETCIALEYDCFVQVRSTLALNIKRFQDAAKVIANADVLRSFAALAFSKNYVKPTLIDSGDLTIHGGRHPVVESFVKQSFVANDTTITDDDKIMILTGPNMAGKSTYMRQVALIVLMAHMGSFVPADSATICIVDKIFTRVGASDNLASGQSTFMVEMNEVAHILHNATPNSLLILDEIGRGTSTLDGLSIAWSVVEYLSANIKAKTLFATHFHELSELEGIVDGVSNYSISVKELEDTVIFLHKIVRGGADRSFGIEVAKLAGVPSAVTERAKVLMSSLIEKDESILGIKPANQEKKAISKDEVTKMLEAINLDNITPLDALKILTEIKYKM
ncbi:MAG: DNA mismatch repair protein MutS [Clostridia bacterium]|jgi:DNA mismatch repair protein MutS|nr:DNA mismatch repair protein MutS [Clostridia bacterium]